MSLYLGRKVFVGCENFSISEGKDICGVISLNEVKNPPVTQEQTANREFAVFQVTVENLIK